MKRAALAVGGVVLTLALAEAALRLVDFDALKPRISFDTNVMGAFKSGYFTEDSSLFWKLAASDDEVDRLQGAVHPDRPIPTATVRPRLLFMGDSCTRLGPDGITFPALLKAFLGKGAEVLTAAVPGYSSHQGLAWLRLQLLAARPDVAVVYFGWNDHWRTNGLTDRQFVDSQSPWHLRLARLWPRSAGSAPLRVPAEDYRANLTAIAGEAATAGIRVLFIRAPAGIDEPARRRLTQTGYIRDDDDPMALHRAYLEILDEVARREGVFVLDAASVFAHVDTPLALLTDDGIHLTAAGHQVMAAIISQAVLRDLLHLIDDPRTPDEAAAETVHALVSGPEAGM